MTNRVVIAGAGHAAGQSIASLQHHGFDGQIVLVGDEPYLPYQRPPLSKKYLSGELPAERLYVKPESFYEDPAITLQLDTRIDDNRPRRQVPETRGGDDVPYDKLVIATGSRRTSLASRRCRPEVRPLPAQHCGRRWYPWRHGCWQEKRNHWRRIHRPRSGRRRAAAGLQRDRCRNGRPGHESRRVAGNFGLLPDRTH